MIIDTIPKQNFILQLRLPLRKEVDVCWCSTATHSVWVAAQSDKSSVGVVARTASSAAAPLPRPSPVRSSTYNTSITILQSWEKSLLWKQNWARSLVVEVKRGCFCPGAGHIVGLIIIKKKNNNFLTRFFWLSTSCTLHERLQINLKPTFNS